MAKKLQMQNKNILSNLKNQVAHILTQLKSLKENKQNQIREINKIEKEYNCLGEMLEPNLPVNNDTIPVFEVVSASGDFVSDKLSNLLNRATEDDRAFLSVVNTGSSAMLTMATYSFVDEIISPAARQKAIALFSHENEREKTKQEIKNFLKTTSPHLVDVYSNANDNLDIVSADPERGAAGMMREVMDSVLGILAPDNEIKSQPWFASDTTSKSGITRAHRLKYIAEVKSLDNKSKELILKNADLFIETVKNLNESFHKRKPIDVEKTKSFFYQAETLLKIFSYSIKI